MASWSQAIRNSPLPYPATRSAMTENDPLSDGDEYELQPIDPEILEHERQRADQKTRQAESAFDIDEVYDELEPIDPINWDDLRAFRFTTRHLLIVTALLSVVMTLIEIGRWTGLFLVVVIALAAGWFYVLRKERRERLERARRREEVDQRIAAKRGEAVDAGQLSTKVDEPEPERAVGPAFRFSFSMKEMMGAMTVAAVLFALVRWMRSRPCGNVVGHDRAGGAGRAFDGFRPATRSCARLVALVGVLYRGQHLGSVCSRQRSLGRKRNRFNHGICIPFLKPIPEPLSRKRLAACGLALTSRWPPPTL